MSKRVLAPEVDILMLFLKSFALREESPINLQTKNWNYKSDYFILLEWFIYIRGFSIVIYSSYTA